MTVWWLVYCVTWMVRYVSCCPQFFAPKRQHCCKLVSRWWTLFTLFEPAPCNEGVRWWTYKYTENSDLMRYALLISLDNLVINPADFVGVKPDHRGALPFHDFIHSSHQSFTSMVYWLETTQKFSLVFSPWWRINTYRWVMSPFNRSFTIAWWIQIFAVFFPRKNNEDTHISPWRTEQCLSLPTFGIIVK